MYTTLTDMRLLPKFGEQRLIHLDHITKTMPKSGFLLSPGVYLSLHHTIYLEESLAFSDNIIHLTLLQH